MPSASPSRLREVLRNARPGQTIDLLPGEYRGPFVIDRPLKLRGQGRRTVLWRRAGPVIYVRTEGVRLERLLVERTVLAQGPLIIHDAGCEPTGMESMELDADALINLGELVPGSTLTLPITITTAHRTEIEVTGLHGAQITPTVLETPGEHRLRLTIDGKAVLRGELLLGEITLREGETTHYLWLSGSVLDSLPPDQALCLGLKKARLYPSARGLLLNRERLLALEIDDIPDGCEVLVQREVNGMLSLYLPEALPSPVLVNGEPLAPHSRRLLAAQDTISLGEATLSVLPAEPLPIAIETPTVIFDAFNASFPEAASLTVRTLKNGWRGQAVPAVSWLSVVPEGYFRVPPMRTHSWVVSLNQEALALPDGAYDLIGGLMIVSPNQVIAVDVQLNVQRPAVALQAEPVDLGEVELGWSTGQVAQVSIANLGRDHWTGEVRANVPWLEVTTSMPISGDAWSEALVEVHFTPDWESLSVGEHDIPDALLVIRPGSDPQPIPARLVVTPPRGHLEVLNAPVLFDEVERNTPLPEFTLEIHNAGGAPWVGQAHPRHGWVQVTPEDIELAPGERARLGVALLDVPADQPLDEPYLVDEIDFVSDDESTLLPDPVGVQLTIVERPPYLVARPVNFPPFVKGDAPPDAQLYVYNMGPTAWQGTVTSHVAWLSVPDREFTCEPEETVEIHISLSEQALATLDVGLSRWDNALTVHGGREPVFVSVQIDVRELPLALHLETPLLNFGHVNGTTAEIPAETVRLLNAGPNPWTGQVALNVAWLSLEGLNRRFSLEIPKMSITEFKVQLNDEVLGLPPGVIYEEKAIQIRGDDQEISVCALLLLSESAPWLEVAPDRLDIAQARSERLAVRNKGTRRWTLQVNAAPWLEAVPADFVLHPGQSQVIEVSYRAQPEDTPPLADERAVVIIGPGCEVGVSVRVAESVIRAAKMAAAAPDAPEAAFAPANSPAEPPPRPADAENQETSRGENAAPPRDASAQDVQEESA